MKLSSFCNKKKLVYNITTNTVNNFFLFLFFCSNKDNILFSIDFSKMLTKKYMHSDEQ